MNTDFQEKRSEVLVSIAPYKFFVDYLSDHTLDTVILVPPGSSPHTYDLTPRQTLNLTQAKIWFTSGDPFEAALLKIFSQQNPSIDIVDTLENIDLIYPNHAGPHCCHKNHEGADNHVWLSPKIAKQQARVIANVLIKHYPENRDLYTKQLESLITELNQLDQDINHILHQRNNQYVMVAHPAFAYFCRDYHLQQLAIEHEGREPNPRELNDILIIAHNHNIKHIFYQDQYSLRAATRIAQELHADTIIINPYAEDYLNNMRLIATNFSH